MFFSFLVVDYHIIVLILGGALNTCVSAVNMDGKEYVGFRWALCEFEVAHKGPMHIVCLKIGNFIGGV